SPGSANATTGKRRVLAAPLILRQIALPAGDSPRKSTNATAGFDASSASAAAVTDSVSTRVYSRPSAAAMASRKAMSPATRTEIAMREMSVTPFRTPNPPTPSRPDTALLTDRDVLLHILDRVE